MKSLKKRNIKNKTVKCNNIPDSVKNITATIDIKSLKNNLDYLRKKSKTDIMPNLRANANGHGIIEIAKLCRKFHIKYIAVETVGEAIQIRNSGDKGRIFAWVYDINSGQIKEAVKKNIDIRIYDESHIPFIIKSIPKNYVANVHLCVDTGKKKEYIPYEKAVDTAIKITKNPKFKLAGVMSGLCCAEKKNDPTTMKQFTLFRELREDLKKQNIIPEVFHISAIDGILNYDNSDFELVRSGLSVYGINENKNFTQIMSLTSKLIQINESDGLVPIGYSDLLPLTKPCKLYVYVNGTKRKVLSISSDQITIEINKKDKIGDEVQLFGDKKHGFKQSIYDIAKQGSTVPLNILSHIGERIKMEYK